MQDIKNDILIGKVTSPEKRTDIAKEFKRTHFKLSG